MVINRLKESLNALAMYTEQTVAPDLDLRLFSPTGTTSNSSKHTQSTILEMLYSVMSVNEGGLTSFQIAQNLHNALNQTATEYDRADVEKKISIFVDNNPLKPEQTMSSIVGTGEGLSLIQIDTIRVTPAGRDTTAVVTFLNMIPTIELSRCVPYLTIDVQTGRPPISSDNRVQGLSIPRFLEGDFVASSTGDRLLISALGNNTLSTDELGETFGVNSTTSGMELFTSPQTLINPVSAPGYVIDKFRPLLSIDKLEVEITPQVGFFAYRSANLDLTLHDRSRLSEIADFIKPDLYGSTELSIEYGWSHPDTTEGSIGSLINAMRVNEKYGVVNSSFSLAKSGEVKIKLKLFSRGMSDMQTIRIGEKGEAVEAVRAVRNLQKAYAAIKGNVLKLSDQKNKEIRGEQQLFASAEDIGTALVLSAQSQDIVRKFLSRNENATNADVKELATILRDLYGSDGKGSKKIADLNKSVSTAINKQLNSLRSDKQSTDPFITSLQEKQKRNPGLKDQATTFSKAKTEYVSFGKLMSVFVGQPLVNKEKYVDVQLIFYPFNAKAGACANYNIAEFPIKISELENGLAAIARSKGLQLTLRDFLQYISNNFIDDMGNPAYGLSNYYTTTVDHKTGVRSAPSNKQNNLDATRLFDAVQARLQKVGSQDGTFKPPQVDVIIETVPVAPSLPGESKRVERLKTILKLHFFDRCSTAYESISSLILASREEDLRTLGNTANNVSSEHTAVFNEIINEAKKAGIARTSNAGLSAIEAQTRTTLAKVNASVNTPDNVYEVTFDIEKLRAFIRQNVPTILYGSNNTGVKDASFATIQNPLLSTVHMLRAGDSSAITPSGLTKANLPLRTIPANVTMTTIGCPLVQYMQQFFIDFNTNTTIDNIYGVNKLSHEISQGRFETRMELVPLDAYGRYESLPTQVGTMLQQLEALQAKQQK